MLTFWCSVATFILFFLLFFKCDKETMYVLTGTTESGDEITPAIFNTKPSNQEVEDYLRETYPEEYENDFIGITNWNIHKSAVVE